MKDALGHGSDSQGGSLSVPDQHQLRIARDTVRNPLKGLFLGGPNAKEAEAILRGKFGHTDAQIAALTGGHPKSKPVPTHPAHEYNRDLALRIRDRQVGSGMKHR
jgi:hypothetical protein